MNITKLQKKDLESLLGLDEASGEDKTMEISSMNISFSVIGALILGAMISIYMPMVSSSSKILGSPIAGNVIFFGVAFITSVVLLMLTGGADLLVGIGKVPLWHLCAGVLSAVMIVGMTTLMPSLGVRVLMILVVAGQVLMAVTAGRFGMLGVPVDEISIGKLAGVMLIIAGIALTVWG